MANLIYGYGLCECGCGQRTNIAPRTHRQYGYVKGEPVRYVFGHKGVRHDPEYIEVEGGCWEWQHEVSPEGYGKCPDKRRAHRVVWERHHGQIPDGAHLHHRCRNRRCVNPAHLEIRDAVEHSRARAREANAVLTIEQVHEIRAVAWTKSTARELGEKFGVTPKQIRHVKRGDSWSDS